MSFQGLMSGAECSVASNPLSQVLKHTEGDRSLQQDRLNTSGPSLNQFRQQPQFTPNQQDLAQAREFFDGAAPGPSSMAAPQPISNFGPHALEPAMPQTARENWAMQPQAAMNGWASEFSGLSQATAGPAQPIQAPITHPNVQNMSQATFSPSYAPWNASTFQSMPMQAWPMQQPHFIEGKGKGKQIDFDAAFDEIAAQVEQATIQDSDGPSQTEQDLLAQFEDAADLNEVLERARSNNLADNLQADNSASQEDIAKWEAELNQMMSAGRDELDTDYASPIANAYKQNMDNPFANEDYVRFDDDGIPILGDYAFEPNNRYLDPSNSGSMLERAKSLLATNGSLSEASLMLEAAIQRNDLGEGGYEAWILLGETRNMDEHEQAGMRALVEGVKRAAENGGHGEGMLSLAISYTNESYDRASQATLLRWVRARFPEHPIPDISTSMTSWHTHEKITEVFISLAREQHARGVVDPDVQIGLGVLFYTNGEYDRAKDCFESALSVRPRDYQLWNRLGSALSNGSKPEEALGAYREALNLRPTYTRAIYNVGVACLNISLFHEAVEHFLSALALQGQAGGESNEQLWFTLRRALLNLDRNDLADLTVTGSRPTNLDVFRKEGFEF